MLARAEDAFSTSCSFRRSSCCVFAKSGMEIGVGGAMANRSKRGQPSGGHKNERSV